MSDQFVQFLGSLAAILVLAAIARGFRLGPAPTLKDESEARRAADEAVDGFAPLEIALDAQGRGAVMSDAQGRILLLRPHGTHFAGRLLTSRAEARVEGETLVVDTAERRFGAAHLEVADPQAWVQRIEAID